MNAGRFLQAFPKLSDSIMKDLSRLITVAVVLAACSVAVADDVEFQRDIAPILEERCWHCRDEVLP